jgi:dephospho-CoA kinase
VLVVDCAPAVQIDRVRRRSGLAEDEIRRIIDAQLPSAEARLSAADDVIDNSEGSLDALRQAGRARCMLRYLELARRRRLDLSSPHKSLRIRQVLASRNGRPNP